MQYPENEWVIAAHLKRTKEPKGVACIPLATQQLQEEPAECSLTPGGQTQEVYLFDMFMMGHRMKYDLPEEEKKNYHIQTLEKISLELGYSGGANDKEPACQCRRPKRCGFNPWVWKIPWRRA